MLDLKKKQNEILVGTTDGIVTVSAITGVTNVITIVRGNPVLFYEYPAVSSSALLHNSDSISLGFINLLFENSPFLKLNEKQQPVLVNNKWIYIFRKSGAFASLVYEVKPFISGSRQKFEYVSWKVENAEKNRTSFPRACESDKLDFPDLEMGEEYYFLLSQVQLPFHRIDYYTKNPDKLAYRAVYRKITKSQTSEVLEIQLVDFVEVCFTLVEEKNRAADLFNKYFSNEIENSKRYCATMVTEIEKKRPEVKKWLDFDAVKRYLDKEELRTKRVKRAKESAFGRLKDWKLSQGYKLTRDDYNGTEELEKKIIEIESVVTSEDELEYLVEIGNDTNSWYYKVFKDENAFFFHRKLANFGAYDELSDVLCKWFIGRILEQFPRTSSEIVFDARKYIDLQMKIIGDFEETLSRIKIKIPELSPVDGKLFYVNKDMRYPKIRYNLKDVPFSRSEADYIAGTKEYEKAMGEWREGVDGVSAACRPILLFIETVNLVISTRQLFHAKKDVDRTFAVVNGVGSFADALSATAFLLKKEMFKYFSEKAIEKGFACVNLVGSICDYIGVLKDISIASYKGQTGLALSHSVFGLAAGTGVVASVATLGGGTATAFGITLSATGIGFVAVFLAAIGAGLIWVFTEEELEEWAKESEWSKYQQRKKPLPEQARDLNEILCRFRAECYILRQISGTVMASYGTFKNYVNELRFQIIPGMFYAHTSRFKVSLQVADDDGLILNAIYGKEVILNKTFEIPDSKTIVAPAIVNKISTFRRYFSKDEFNKLPDFQYDKLVYKYTVQLDLNGDGKDLYSQKPLASEGRIKPRMHDDCQM